MKWEENEDRDLINVVVCCREQKLPILNGIKLHAKKYQRSISSVKKHYYKLCPSGDKETLKKALMGVIESEKVVNISEYKKPKLTDKDLELLFRGLVRLIKEQCQSDYKGT